MDSHKTPIPDIPVSLGWFEWKSYVNTSTDVEVGAKQGQRSLHSGLAGCGPARRGVPDCYHDLLLDSL